MKHFRVYTRLKLHCPCEPLSLRHSYSVGESQMRRKSQLFQIRLAREIDHRRRAAHQHDRIVAARMQTGGDHFVVHEAFAVLPVWQIEHTHASIT